MANPGLETTGSAVHHPHPSISGNKQVDTTHFPEKIVASSDQATYLKAAEDFLHLDQKRFLHQYPELSIPVRMYEDAIRSGQLDPDMMKSRMADEIAASKFPVIDHDKSRLMATTFASAKTAEQRAVAIKTYPQLEEAFKVADALKGQPNIPPDAIEDQIEKGMVPRYTELIAKIAAHAAARQAEQQEHLPEPAHSR